jgi:hypothetical protein
MSLQALSPAELASSRTLFSSFMGCAGERFRTFAELLEIYRERSPRLRLGDDPEDHLRVERFRSDMADARWREDVRMRIGVFDGRVLVVDGIHRGIAYLACLQDGAPPERLPPLGVAR